MQNLINFKKKTVLITGGGKNIGRSIVEVFLHQGADIVVNDILPLEKCEVSKEILSFPKFSFSQGDITSFNYRERLIKETLSKFLKIDVLVNNVGIGSGEGFFDIQPEIMKKSIETNLVAPFFLSQKVAKQMVKTKTGGSIIFISSIHAKIPSGNADYSSTKSALNILVKEMAFELGRFGIRVNGIAPGKIDATVEKDNRIPLQNISGLPDDIAKAVLFFADSNFSRYITGEILTVDGGLSLDFQR